jgi:hypothetical protein
VKLDAVYSSPNIIGVIKSRRLLWAGNIARKDYRRGAYRDLVEKLEETRLLVTPRCRRENNIKINL